MFDAVERVRIVELVGLGAFLVAGVVTFALGTWSFLSVLDGLPVLVVQNTGAVDEVSFGLVFVSALLGLGFATVGMLGWLCVTSLAYGCVKALVGWE
jgi:uncharacterized membrane protein